MCRFVAYMGQPILLSDLIIKPKNSLINQSIKANEAEEPLNGDGFGIGWYMPTLDPTPGLFVSVRPAWNDQNLNYLAGKIKSDCIFAHVRASTKGMVTEINCHPFHYGNYLFMHNGDIEGFNQIKRAMTEKLSDEYYGMIKGQTDSEHLFAMTLDILSRNQQESTAPNMGWALEQAIQEVQNIKKKLGVEEDSYINVAFTDGNDLVAIRYISKPDLSAPTLYYSEGTAYECIDGVCRMKQEEEDKAVLVVSEKLTAYRSDWHEIPVNHILLVDSNLHIELRPVRESLIF
jgi:glutamine amidotransferase